MKFQIQRFSPHQNAKIMAILMALTMIVFLVPFTILQWVITPPGVAVYWGLNLLMPFLYLIVGYLSIFFTAWVYNTLAPRLGGVEFFAEVTRTDPAPDQH